MILLASVINLVVEFIVLFLYIIHYFILIVLYISINLCSALVCFLPGIGGTVMSGVWASRLSVTPSQGGIFGAVCWQHKYWSHLYHKLS